MTGAEPDDSYRQDAKDAKDGAGLARQCLSRTTGKRPAPSLAILASWR